MKPIKHFVVMIFLLLTAPASFAQNAENAKIDALVRSIDRVVKKTKSPELVFAEISDTGSTKDDWHKFASEAALEKHRKTSETYSIAYCWRKGGKLAAANFTLFSASGDWTKYVNSYYRPDGTLAKVAVDYRTFHGDIILEQDLYFNTKGDRIKKVQRVLDLQTHKPKKVTRDIRESAESMAKEVDYYKSTSTLPFAKLLK